MHGRRKRDNSKEDSAKRRKDEIPTTNTNSNTEQDDEDSEPEFPTMEFRHLGRSGLKVSVVSLGAWVNFGEKINEDAVVECIKMARKAGINYFDTAEIYGNGRAEIVLGRAIKRCDIKRSDLVISTKLIKCGPGPNDQGLSMKHITEGLDASLERLQLRYVDMVYCHRPDPTTPIEETVRAMSLVITQGKAFYWGTSEWSVSQVMEAHSIARQYMLIPPSMEQLEYNLFRRERVEKEFTPVYKTIGLGICGWSPLAYGLLSGKYNEGIPHNSRFAMEKFKDYANRLLNSEEGKLKIEKIKKLESLAEYLECTMAQLAIAWCLKNTNISCVITGASNPNQIKENVNALRFVSKLTDAICKQIEDILGNKVVPDTPPTWARYQPQTEL